MQHELTFQLAEKLGDKVVGLMVSWKGNTLHVSYSKCIWWVEGGAVVGGDIVNCYSGDESAETAMDEVAEKIAELEDRG